MKNEFVFVIKFRGNNLYYVAGIETAIKLAKRSKKNLILLGETGSFDIYYGGVLIAQF